MARMATRANAIARERAGRIGPGRHPRHLRPVLPDDAPDVSVESTQQDGFITIFMTLVSLWPTDEKRDTRTQKRDKKREAIVTATAAIARERAGRIGPGRHPRHLRPVLPDDKKRETKVVIRESIQLTRPERHQGAQGEDGADGELLLLYFIISVCAIMPQSPAIVTATAAIARERAGRLMAHG
jgi:hypothetical protein